MVNAGLIVVDVQNDFIVGSLPVPDGIKVIRPLNKLIKAFTSAAAPIAYTRDWHPVNHCSFKEYGGIWPPHCVKNTYGAAFHPDLFVPLVHKGQVKIISKATTQSKEAYSGFQGTNLNSFLKNVNTLVIGGLATDYCVKNTTLDAIKLGYVVIVVSDGVRAVSPEDDTLELLERRGATLKTSNEIKRWLNNDTTRRTDI